MRYSPGPGARTVKKPSAVVPARSMSVLSPTACSVTVASTRADRDCSSTTRPRICCACALVPLPSAAATSSTASAVIRLRDTLEGIERLTDVVAMSSVATAMPILNMLPQFAERSRTCAAGFDQPYTYHTRAGPRQGKRLPEKYRAEVAQGRRTGRPSPSNRCRTSVHVVPQTLANENVGLSTPPSQKIQAAGGKIVTPNTPIPGMGAYTRVSDTEGNVIGLFQGQ
jgi:hypothetical protein